MIAGSKVVGAYKNDMDEYLKCVQTKLDAIPAADPKTLKGDDKKTAEQNMKEKEQLTKKYDSAVHVEKANAERFNVQLRIYKAKNK